LTLQTLQIGSIKEEHSIQLGLIIIEQVAGLVDLRANASHATKGL
jgi:hypothetical protein